MSAFSDAYAEVSRAVQPDVEPTLTHGDGGTADPTKELDSIILASARGALWSAAATLTYGQIVFPLTRNGHRYRVTTGGTTGSAEPSWGTSDYTSVSDNTVVYEEAGGDFASIYDVRQAKYDAWNLRAAKASARTVELSDARGQATDYRYLNAVRERDRYQAVGIA